jgi:predicted nucleotidyltransferase
LRILNRHRVRYLIIGAYATIYYAEPRYTKDLDIWVEPEANNARKVYAALKEFGAPLKNIRPADFNNRKLIYQVGVEPVRVDIIMGVCGLEFEDAFKDRKAALFDGVKVNIIGLNGLIESKKKAGRRLDYVDVENLRRRLESRKK